MAISIVSEIDRFGERESDINYLKTLPVDNKKNRQKKNPVQTK